ncbi:RTKN protein, partial [Rhodinocichla rosea]|nr:RTKN protein [Rhodinocichla rosea]
MYRRDERSRATVAEGSALDMELRRGCCCPPAPAPQEPELQRALQRALRVREGFWGGARRLLPACSRPEQALETTKTLVLCEARVVAAGGELQRRQEARLRGARRPSEGGPGAEPVPCRGTVCISDLRIPLMWKDTEYFRNKGGDAEAGPDFELRLELYSAGLPGPGAQGSAPRKLASRLSTSLGRSSGRRARAAMEGGPASPPGTGTASGGALLLPPPGVPPAGWVWGHCPPCPPHVPPEQSLCWVGLGSVSPCVPPMSPQSRALPGVLGSLTPMSPPCPPRAEPVLGGFGVSVPLCPPRVPPRAEPAGWVWALSVPQDTRVRALQAGGRGQPPGVAVTNRLGGEEVTHGLLADSTAEAQRWLQAWGQHLCDLGE